MNKKTFIDEFGKLEDYHGKKLSNAQRDIIWEQLKWVHDDDFKSAVVTSINKDRLGSLPTPDTLKTYADESRARRSSQAQRQDRQQARDFFKPTGQEEGIARQCVMFIDDLFKFPAKSKERCEYVTNWCEMMNKQYPKAGFLNDMYHGYKLDLIRHYSKAA